MRRIRLTLLVLAFASTPAHALAQLDLPVLREHHKLLPADGSPVDHFGAAVAISDGVVVVGAPFHDHEPGAVHGAAYVFDAATGNQLFELLAADTYVGHSVAISGTAIAVGAPNTYRSTGEPGAVYLFDVTTGAMLHQLLASDVSVGNNFGWSVALTDEYVLVGARDATPSESGPFGAVYVFDVATGSELRKLVPHDSTPGDGFGYSVAAFETIVVAGRPWNRNHGAVYLFDLLTGQQSAHIPDFVPSDVATGSFFGYSVSIRGPHLVVGAPRALTPDPGDGGDLWTGAAYIVDASTGQMLHRTINGLSDPRFGESVALSSTTVLVGGPLSSAAADDSGVAYYLDLASGQRTHKLLPNVSQWDDHFGQSVGITEDWAVVGAPEDDFIRERSGSAYVFRTTPPLVELSVTNPTPFPGQSFDVIATALLANSATLEPGIGPIPASGGTFPVSITEPTTFVLRATNAQGSETTELEVEPRAPSVSLVPATAEPFPGETIELGVHIVGATSARLDPIFGVIPPESATYDLTIQDNVTFVLSATNVAGTSTVEVDVIPRPPEVTLSAIPSPLVAGEEATLSWTMAGADDVTVSPVGITSTDAEGSIVVMPMETTTYTARAKNSAGVSITEATVEVVPFLPVSFAATPDFIVETQESVLSWDVRGSAEVEIEGLGPQPVVGSLAVSPAATTTYTLNVSSGEVSTSLSTTVTVVRGASLSFSWSPSVVPGLPPALLPLTPFEVYVVASSTEVGLQSYELSLTHTDCLIVLEEEFFPHTATNSGTISPGERSYLVNLGTCRADLVIPLVRLRLLALDLGCLESGLLSLGPIQPSSLDPPRFAYRSCSDGLHPFRTGAATILRLAHPIPAVEIELSAEPLDAGVRLQWSIPAGLDPDSVTLWRSEAAQIDARTVLGSWSADDNAPTSYLDADVSAGRRYLYEIAAYRDGLTVLSQQILASTKVPARRSHVASIFPNPFNPSTKIRFEITEPGPASLEIFDAAGRRVRGIDLGHRGVGSGAWEWNGRDDRGREVVSGVYRIQLRAHGQVDIGDVTLVR